jgi:hypothetical protein
MSGTLTTERLVNGFQYGANYRGGEAVRDASGGEVKELSVAIAMQGAVSSGMHRKYDPKQIDEWAEALRVKFLYLERQTEEKTVLFNGKCGLGWVEFDGAELRYGTRRNPLLFHQTDDEWRDQEPRIAAALSALAIQGYLSLVRLDDRRSRVEFVMNKLAVPLKPVDVADDDGDDRATPKLSEYQFAILTAILHKGPIRRVDVVEEVGCCPRTVVTAVQLFTELRLVERQGQSGYVICRGRLTATRKLLKREGSRLGL